MNVQSKTLVAAVLAAAAVGLSGCANTASATPDGVAPVVLTPVQGTDLKTVSLSEAAARRLDLQTATVQPVAAKHRTAVPYAALVYDEQGGTWTFVKNGSRTFVREPVVVDKIDHSSVVLRSGPTVGTEVVTTGVEELLGAEYEVSGE